MDSRSLSSSAAEYHLKLIFLILGYLAETAVYRSCDVIIDRFRNNHNLTDKIHRYFGIQELRVILERILEAWRAFRAKMAKIGRVFSDQVFKFPNGQKSKKMAAAHNAG